MSNSSLSGDHAGHNIADVVQFEIGKGGMTRASIVTDQASASLYLHGAHVELFQPKGEEPVLFMSGESLFDPKKAIRGGVPLIFPWFGALASNPAAPQHGFARTAEWSVESTKMNDDGSATVVLSLHSSEATRKAWPNEFAAKFTVTVGTVLEMTLQIRNTGGQAFTFEEALHTYLKVGAIQDVGVTGLAGAQYIDKVDGFKRKTQGAEPIRVTGETDRVYLDTQGTCVVDDPTMNRRIVVEKSGSDSTVVWNPWVEKSKAMADFGDEEWPGMICIETANAAENAVTLEAGGVHEMTARIRVERR